MQINVKMPTIVGILTFVSRINSCSAELGVEKFYNLGLYCIHVSIAEKHSKVAANLFAA